MIDISILANNFVDLIRNSHCAVTFFAVDVSYLCTRRERGPLQVRFCGNHKYEGLVVLMAKLHKPR